MDLLQKNPFTTLKANDLDDSDINEQWVDVEGDGLVDLFSPTHFVSQYLVGGKGSGKTHLMRYFSYRSQALRNENNLLEGIAQDGYFGIYFQASGLNGSRFDNLPYDNNQKAVLFEYALELWCAALVMEAVIYLYEKNSNLLVSEEGFCAEFLSFFNVKEVAGIEPTLGAVKTFLANLSKAIDLEVNNAFFKDALNVDILTSRGALIFGLPALLKKHSPYFEKISFLYLIDELENISESQQRYLNTLLREKKLPVSFRLGVRTHGIKTSSTLGGGEQNREGHEFEVIRLDNIYSETKKYEDFAFNLIFNRLLRAGFISNSGNDSIEYKKQVLRNMFEEPETEEFSRPSRRGSSKGMSAVMRAFNARLTSKLSKKLSSKIIRNLSFPSDTLVELAAVHLFSQEWSKQSLTESGLVDLSEKLKYEITMLPNVGKESLIVKKIKYYKNNYTASSLRALYGNNLEEYLGIDNLLSMTKGFPRHILTVLRNVYKLEVFQGRAPFSPENKISLKSQKLALKESSDWFHDDCVTEGRLGSSVAVALSRLCELLRVEMYADKPVECSASGFTVDSTAVNEKAKEVLDWATLVRVLVKSDAPRQEKNSQKLISIYYLNGLLCPKWGLSVSRRGALSFSPENFNKIFDPELESEYEKFKLDFYNSRYVPFGILADNEVNCSEDDSVKQLGLGF